MAGSTGLSHCPYQSLTATTSVCHFQVSYKHSNPEVLCIFSDLTVSNWTLLLHRFSINTYRARITENSDSNKGFPPSGCSLHPPKSYVESINGGVRDRWLTQSTRADVLLLRKKNRTFQN